MNSSLANLLARLSGPALRLLPQSVSDQASKMFVKRLLKHLFDRLEQLFAQLCWAALTGLFQAFWLSVLQKVAGRAAVVSAVASPSSSKRASGASTPVGAAGGVEAAEVAEREVRLCFFRESVSDDAGHAGE
ncbi:hypothetical protein SLS58_008037 [Diplodia intermedia]|uniref:Uncharacterized protein n=1 Tax=Diplodia intermedia TaxID=856260 RepID=A0ABR3TIE7_9PEZI